MEQDTDPEVRGEPHAGVVRHGRLPRRRPAVFAAQAVAIAAAVVLVGAGSVAAVETWQVVRSAKPPVSLAMPGDDVRAAPTLTAQSGEVNLLLVATDTRDGQGTGFDDPANRAASSGVGNNDTTILVHIAADHTNMAVVSFPRDLVIPVPACTNDTGSVTPASSAAMLNTALARGGERHGLACVAKTVEQLTGLRIPYAGMITFDGVVAMADAVGGVRVCLATPIRDQNVTPPLDLRAGDQELSGAEAAAFLRSRKGVGDSSDLGRISNQQTFMSALARQTVSAGTLTNPATVLRLAETAAAHMTLSDTLADPATLARMALAVQNVGLSEMVFVQYPVVDDPADPNRVIVADGAAEQLDAALRAGEPVVLGTDSLGRSAVLDPSASASPSAGSGSSAGGQSSGSAAPSATGQPTASTSSPAPSTRSPLPDSVSGQRADTVTCAAKR
ncbi:LytR family transcriptional regulator [Curtobacterium sp. 'Ferrero']|uniref:LCP family protein n=1 Tax=Curtobacterium sp. 'Ferrero' TaxID=2033654 RepID=UPI000BC47E64|nr:LCP family protein [Curtobacterium sp. 'Ferrero']PCN48644.1 LytR family transcriptional regulator [Curtobacterium sp. 'Ferrero']